MEQLKINPASLQPQDVLPNSLKANPATVSRAIQLLFSAYRRDDFADPEGFVAQLGVILCDFPEEVVNYITSPKTGMQRRSKWPPTISEVLSACEDHQNHLVRLRSQRPLAPRICPPVFREIPAGSLARIFVPEGHVRYPELVTWAETAQAPYWKFGKASDGRQGIWVSSDIWESQSQRGRL